MATSERLGDGRAAFNRGEYFQAHELWEEAWRELEGDERLVVQGLIQIAGGLHHLKQGRPRPASGLLRKGLEKLGASVSLADLRVGELARGVTRLLADLDVPGGNAPDPSTLEL